MKTKGNRALIISVTGLFLWTLTDQAMSKEVQKEFWIDGIRIVMNRSEMNYSGFTTYKKDEQAITVKVPNLTKAMVTYYRSNQYMDYVDEVESRIGIATIAEGKLWFGMSFYAGEGMEGMGGVGFFDPELQRIGILRHPALVDCSVEEIQVTPSEIMALTYSQGELSGGICNGLVTINRKTLASTIQLPKGKIQLLWDKDDELSTEEKLARKHYETATSNLAEHFINWEKKPGPSFTNQQSKEFTSIELEKLMLSQADTEYQWFDQAVQHGKVKYEQSCTMTASKKQICTPSKDCPPRKPWGWTGTTKCNPPLQKKEDCDGEEICSKFLNLVELISSRDNEDWNCSDHGWLTVELLSDDYMVGYSPWPFSRFFAPGRLHDPFDNGGNPPPIATVNTGYQSEFYYRGNKNTFLVESIETIDVTCRAPFEKVSGPVIKAMNTKITTIEINHTYVPQNIKGMVLE